MTVPTHVQPEIAVTASGGDGDSTRRLMAGAVAQRRSG